VHGLLMLVNNPIEYPVSHQSETPVPGLRC
jgi:hypothetical protein